MEKKQPFDKSLYTASFLMPDKKKSKPKTGAIKKLNSDPEKAKENMELLEKCALYWASLQDFRDRRARSRKYERGDQWHELITNDDGETTTEEDHITSQNRLALKHNVIRQLSKNLIGQYRTNQARSVVNSRTREDASLSEMMTNALQAAKDLNDYRELDAQQFHEHILSGMIVSKVGFDYWKELDRNDVSLENINVNRIFFNTEMIDVRTRDLNLIGEIIDTDLDVLIAKFARSKADEDWINAEYSQERGYLSTIRQDALSAASVDELNFYYANDGKARLYEVWHLKSEWRLWVHDYADGSYKVYPMSDKPALEQEMKNRLDQAIMYDIPAEEVAGMEIEERYEQFWYVKYLTPGGSVLFEGETPYLHQSHPYVMSLYPLLDGEVWGLIEDVIDQQRYINRLISLLDYIIGTSAKGLLLIPEGTVPDYMSPEDFADEWTKVGGSIVYKAKPGVPAPSVISSNSTNLGASEILGVEMQLINQLTGVNQAIQGQKADSATPASRYAMEAQNSSMNNRDVLDSFTAWIQRRDNKVLQTILQFYDEKVYLGVSGHSYSDEAKYYDPEKVKDIVFMVNISAGSDTPVYRQMIDDTLFRLLELQAIDSKMFLENSSLPFADKILDSISKRQEEINEQGMEQGIDPSNPLGSVPPELAESLQQAGGVAQPQVFN